MIYSVRRHDGRYDYYRSDVERPAVSGGPTAGLGVAVDEALPVLPANSVQEGTGERARGVLCRGLGGTEDRGAWFWVLAIGLGLWWVSNMYQLGKDLAVK